MVIEDIIVKYLAGEAEAHEIAILEQWRKSSVENESHFGQMARLWEHANDLHMPKLNVDTAWNKVNTRIGAGKTGYMASVRNLTKSADKWIAGGVPITMMMNMERRHGKLKPVIQKALVKLDGAPFRKLADHRDEWALNTSYIYPGPIQYFGPSEVCDSCTKTLELEQN